MTADPYVRLGDACLLGALDADERLAYEAHLATCRRCRASLAGISAIPPLLAGLDESVFAAPPEAGVPRPLPDRGSLKILKDEGYRRACGCADGGRDGGAAAAAAGRGGGGAGVVVLAGLLLSVIVRNPVTAVSVTGWRVHISPTAG